MKLWVFAAFVGLLFFGHSTAKIHLPNVQVYSRNQGEFGKPNVIICHVTGFYPPEIQIEILRNNEVIPGATQTDLAFEENWQYYLTKHVKITPREKEEISCRVTHQGNSRKYVWEPDM